ncbi:MAG: hypothetical protein ACTSXF_10715 [Promethearchaeota archaeon]
MPSNSGLKQEDNNLNNFNSYKGINIPDSASLIRKDPETGEILDAPANLTAIVITTTDIQFLAMNQSIEWFSSEWGRIFNYENNSTPLPILIANLSLPVGGLNSTEIKMLNNSLLIGNARNLINYSWYAPANDIEVVLSTWTNDTYGNGWALYAGSMEQTERAVAFYASTLSKFDGWDYSKINILEPRFSYLIGTMSSEAKGLALDNSQDVDKWKNNLDAFKSSLTRMVERCFTGFTVFTRFESLSNISDYLDDYNLTAQEKEEHALIYNSSINALKTYLDLAADYGLKIYLYTDELVLTQKQYDWLMDHLNYSGPALKDDYPPHLSPDAPGLWNFINAKYDAIVDAVSTILTPDNKNAFGGFYFRTDDLSNPYPYKYSVFSTSEGFQKLINITCDAAARLNATAIHRVWRLGEKESVFNNATIAKEVLDPINVTNLVLRCKETWNDHWYDHPPNPVIGVSHHKWIIGWYTGAAMPDYKGNFFDRFFNETNWSINPNVVGYDLPPLQYISFQRLDYRPFYSANTHYLFMKMFFGNMSGNETLRRYFHQVGIGNETIIVKLTDIFNKVHEGFRLISFWQAWASSGKFTGDVLNGGNSMLFEPGRFTKFYNAVRESNYSAQYTIDEAYRGLDYIVDAFNEFPDSYNGQKFPELKVGYLDPEYANDPTNITEELLTLRGNLRQFKDFAYIFAPYRAWHLTYYLWGETLDPRSWWQSERYREETLRAYNDYLLVWGNSSYWYQVNFRDFTQYWLPLVGKTNIMRINLLADLFLFLATIISMLYVYSGYLGKYKGDSAIKQKETFNSLVFGRLYKRIRKYPREKTELSEENEKDRSPNEDISLDIAEETEIRAINLSETKDNLFGGILLPLLSIGIFIYMFIAITLNFMPDLILLTLYISLSLYSGILLSFVIFKKTNLLRIIGFAYVGSIAIFFVPSVIIFLLGGLFIFTSSTIMLGIVLLSLLISIAYGYAVIINNLNLKRRFLKYTLWIPICILSFAVLSIIILFYGGYSAFISKIITDISVI